MLTRYIERSIEPVLKRAAREFPVVVLTGPRQSGKTTTLKHLFEKKYSYVSLELPDIHAIATSDPRGFIETHPPPVIFDEIQNIPDLLPYIKHRVDANRTEYGQYILTGSQNLLMLQRVTESLAGRAAILRLLPLSQREAVGHPHANLPWESRRKRNKRETVAYNDLWKRFLRGGYPELAADQKRDIALWHASYVQTYLERDVRSLRQVGDLTLFQAFLRALAARSSQLFNISGMARDLGISVNTVKAWLSVLEATHQVIILRPFHANVGKRLVKSPKIYFADVGTLCYLTGLKDPEHAASGPMGGAILETAVIVEIVKTYVHRGEEPQVFFWRTSTGTEVDFIVEANGELIPIEVKLSSTSLPAMAAGIKSFRRDLGNRASKGYVVHPGEVLLSLGPDATAIPFAML